MACGDALYGNHTHFEDKNVFNHCMPSKATMSSHISKTTMSSVITCLQKATMTLIYISKMTMSSVLRTFKGDNVLIYISKTKMSSVIACLQKVTMYSFAFWRRQCLHLKNFNILFPCASEDSSSFVCTLLKRKKESKWKWKWIKREKKEFQCLHAFMGFTAWICASGW